MKKWISVPIILGLIALFGLILIQSGKGIVMVQSSNSLNDYGPAPAWDNEVRLNTDHPLWLEELRGKVVLLEMWTFG